MTTTTTTNRAKDLAVGTRVSSGGSIGCGTIVNVPTGPENYIIVRWDNGSTFCVDASYVTIMTGLGESEGDATMATTTIQAMHEDAVMVTPIRDADCVEVSIRYYDGTVLHLRDYFGRFGLDDARAYAEEAAREYGMGVIDLVK